MKLCVVVCDVCGCGRGVKLCVMCVMCVVRVNMVCVDWGSEVQWMRYD